MSEEAYGYPHSYSECAGGAIGGPTDSALRVSDYACFCCGFVSRGDPGWPDQLCWKKFAAHTCGSPMTEGDPQKLLRNSLKDGTKPSPTTT